MQLSRSAPTVIAAIAAMAALLSAPIAAQRQHVAGLIGEPPDTSNWPHPAAPDGNPFPRSTAPASDLKYRDAKAQLGKTLFWEEQVSSDNTMSCGTCHAPAAGGTDFRAGGLHANGNVGSFGMIRQHASSPIDIDYNFAVNPSPVIDRQITPLHAPTMIGAYVFERLFWDQRAGPDFVDSSNVTIPNFTDWAACEDLSVGPVISDVEMGHEGTNWTTGFIQRKLDESYPLALVDPTTIPPDIQWITGSGATYQKIFDSIFGGDPQFGGAQGVTRERFALAVAHYMRTLIPDQAPIDLGTMSDREVEGFRIMLRSDCFRCHSTSHNPQFTTPFGILLDPFDNPFSDGNMHDIGFGPVKTPTLRNVGLRQRFFSTGQVSTLSALVDFYDNQPFGGPELQGSGPGGTLTPSEKAAVMAFLGNALTDPRVKAESFPFDRPQLASERSDFFPFEVNEYGTATPCPRGQVAEIIANAPPLVTKPVPSGMPTDWFKVGVGQAPPNAPAYILIDTAAGAGPTIWVGPGSILTFVGNTDADGIATVHVPFPLVPATVGTTFYAQWMFVDYGRRCFSDAARFRPFWF